MPNVMTTQDEACSVWQLVPDAVLLHAFSFLPARVLLTASRVCKSWHRVAMDEYLWKDLLYRAWHIDTRIAMAPGKLSWLQEFKRLFYHTPQIESEVLHDHRDQVLHISFSHNGQMFATSSKDGYIKVWTAAYPSRVVYYADMREFKWKYTQFSQFNETDTLLLVSGVHFGAHSTSGEIAVFNLVDGFELQCRVLNKPYDIFGTWYNENYLLSGNLHWLGHLTSCSVLWLNKASQALEAENESVVMRLYKFRNINASSIRTVMIAKCHDEESKAHTTCPTVPSSSSSTPVPSTSSLAGATGSSGSAVAGPSGLVPANATPAGDSGGGWAVPTTSAANHLAVPTSPVSMPSTGLPSPQLGSGGGAGGGGGSHEVVEDMSMKGVETSQSECSQGKAKRKENKIKMWQKVQVLTDGDRGVRLLEVDDSNDDGEETIEYNMDYRLAEMMDVPSGGDHDHLQEPGECAPAASEEANDKDDDFDMVDYEVVCSQEADSAVATRDEGDRDMRARDEPGTDMSTPEDCEMRRLSCASSSAFVNVRQPAESAACPAGEETGGICGHGGEDMGTVAATEGARGGSGDMSHSRSKGGMASSRDTDKRGRASTSGQLLDAGASGDEDGSASADYGCSNISNSSSNSPFSVSPLPGAFAPRVASATTVAASSGDCAQLPIEATCTAAAPQPLPSTSAGCRMSELDFSGTGDRYLIFTTGMRTYTPHRIGIKRIRSLQDACQADVEESTDGLRLLPNVDDNELAGPRKDEFDTVDHLIELHGHIIGMCLSPDHRYLYVNSRPWPQGYEIDDPLYPPPIAQEIDIHVIDLTTMHEVGTMLRAHKAYTPNDECFFIFLDVCQEYVASGAEDKHGYLWDRHYGVCLTKFPHADVVNSVAFNPQDPEMLITASDDNSLKIWRSRNREQHVKGNQTKLDY